MENTRQSWSEYKERLTKYGYTEEQLESVRLIRETSEHCPDEQFKELVSQGVLVRLAKLKKPRNYYVTEDGDFVFLNHYNKRFEIAAKFKEE